MAPPLIGTKEQTDEAVLAVQRVVELVHSPTVFWTEALGLARRVVDI
ncbi:MAG: hypothetical protein JOY54_04115 [Acidobacteriaceae bacterium]|nr:hypothetical protein [Acidobacteriaceae bacterium]